MLIKEKTVLGKKHVDTIRTLNNLKKAKAMVKKEKKVHK